jgi:hypothetical protein
MRQSHLTSLLEAATQAGIGLPIGLLVSFCVAALGLSAAATAVVITGLMFVFSTARGYVIRRRFERFAAREGRERAIGEIIRSVIEGGQ